MRWLNICHRVSSHLAIKSLDSFTLNTLIDQRQTKTRASTHFLRWGKQATRSDFGCLASACSLHFTSDVVQINVCMQTLHCKIRSNQLIYSKEKMGRFFQELLDFCDSIISSLLQYVATNYIRHLILNETSS